MSNAPLSVQDAAAQIVALINVRPQSPWQGGNQGRSSPGAITPTRLTVELLAPPSGDAALSAEHMEYRQVVAEIDRFNDPEYLAGVQQQEQEALITALMERESALARQIWAKPAVTPADVLLRGEIALHNENSLMEVLEEPVVYDDEYACAQLIKAVVSIGCTMDSTRSECFWHRVVVDDEGRWEDWLCDPTAKLSHGCRVVVRLHGDLMLVGAIANKRPVDFRRAVIAFRDVDGCECRTRIFGRKDADTQVARVVGVFTPADALLHLERSRGFI